MTVLQHCLIGWNAVSPATLPTASSVSLSDALTGVNPKHATVSVCLSSLSVCLFACWPFCLFAGLSVSWSVCRPLFACWPLSVCLLACLSVCLLACLSAGLSDGLSVWLLDSLSVGWPAYLAACLVVCWPVCPSACPVVSEREKESMQYVVYYISVCLFYFLTWIQISNVYRRFFLFLLIMLIHVCLPVFLSRCLLACLSACLFIYVHVIFFACLSVLLFTSHFLCLSVCLFFYRLVFLPVFFFCVLLVLQVLLASLFLLAVIDFSCSDCVVVCTYSHFHTFVHS